MNLRDYQSDAVDAIKSYLSNQHDKHPVASLPTGSGKSHVIAALVEWAIGHADTHVLIVTHTRELVQQDANKIVEAIPAIDVGIFCAGLRKKQIAPVTVASIQSIVRKADTLPPLDMIIVDEAHRIPHGDDGMYRALFRTQPQARIIGLTATPYRLNGGMLHEGDDALFDDLVYEGSTLELIQQGYLCRVRARATPAHADLSGIHTRGGEFIAGEMARAFDEEKLTSAAVKDVLENTQDRRSIMVFCCSVEHCKHVETAFQASGQTSIGVVTEETTAGERDRLIAQFKSGVLRILINCNVLTTGFDAPNVDCIVLLRATQSPGLYVQIVGRGLRLHEVKQDCLLLDYGQNVERHGPLDTITAHRATSGEGPVRTKTCPQCESIIAAGFKTCPECSYVFTGMDRTAPRHDTQAGFIDPLAGVPAIEFEVRDVEYRLWPAKPGKRETIRVSYQVGLADWVHEWICPEHTGQAQARAAAWFARRGVRMPLDVKEALLLVHQLEKPLTILVQKARTRNDYDQILSYRFAPRQMELSAAPEPRGGATMRSDG